MHCSLGLGCSVAGKQVLMHGSCSIQPACLACLPVLGCRCCCRRGAGGGCCSELAAVPCCCGSEGQLLALLTGLWQGTAVLPASLTRGESSCVCASSCAVGASMLHSHWSHSWLLSLLLNSTCCAFSSTPPALSINPSLLINDPSKPARSRGSSTLSQEQQKVGFAWA